MGTYSDPALILPGAVGAVELDSAHQKNVASGIPGLDANTEIETNQLELSILMAVA